MFDETWGVKSHWIDNKIVSWREWVVDADLRFRGKYSKWYVMNKLKKERNFVVKDISLPLPRVLEWYMQFVQNRHSYYFETRRNYCVLVILLSHEHVGF